jgi:hypothetical protein
MDNIEMNVEGNILTIKIDLTQRLGVSTSGKTIKVASTGSPKKVEGFPHIKVGVNAFVDNPAREDRKPGKGAPSEEEGGFFLEGR